VDFVDGRLIHRMKAGSATWQLPPSESVPSNWVLRLARLRLFIVGRQQQRRAHAKASQRYRLTILRNEGERPQLEDFVST